MHLPTTNPATTTTTVTTTSSTYTTIPISTNDVISRSLHNMSVFLSLRRPWPEFLDTDVLDRPESFNSAVDRIRKNATYFRLNYGLVLFAGVLLFLIGNPLSLLFVSFIFGLWLVFYLFREDPLYMYGHHVTDQMVLIGLVLVSVVTLWITGIVENLILGVGMGLVFSAIHGALRNPDGLFLNEDDAASTGLIGSAAGSYPRPVQRIG